LTVRLNHVDKPEKRDFSGGAFGERGEKDGWEKKGKWQVVHYKTGLFTKEKYEPPKTNHIQSGKPEKVRHATITFYSP